MKWYKIFDSKEKALATVPVNTAKLLKIGERKFAIANYKNQLFITDDRCPHNGDSLSNGRINHLGEIICPWHNYQYHLQSGKEAQDRSGDLTTYVVENRDDGIYVGIP